MASNNTITDSIKIESGAEVDGIGIDIDSNTDADDDVIELDGKKSPIGKQKGKRSRSRKCYSAAWKHFEPVVGSDNVKQAKCKGCGVKYKVDGTCNMLGHIQKCPRKDAIDIGQAIISMSDGKFVQTKFDANEFRELVAKAIIKHDLPFHFVTWDGIKEVFRYFKPDLHIVSRNTCRADCMKIYNREKIQVKSLLESTSSRICLTSDCWSSITTDGYVCLTGHFVDKDWNIQKRILNFCYLPPPHSGVALCEKIHNFLCGWKIDSRIFSLTLDNASANNTCVDLLRNLLNSKGTLLNHGEFFHLRCSAHILNLIVQDGLNEIDGSIVKIRESIKYVKGSQARKVKFLECVSLCTLDSKKGLRQDVPTRWNATFLMLDSALYYQNAFIHLRLSDSNYKHCPSDDEWGKVEKICKFLRVFNDITCHFSGSKYVTANLFFPLVFTAHLTLKENMVSEDSYIASMAANMMEKFNKYWSDYSRILAIAVILDPRYKMGFVEYCYKKLYGNDGLVEARQVRIDLYALYSEYEKSSNMENACGLSGESNMSKNNSMLNQSASSSSVALDWGKEFDSLDAADLTPQKSQLDLYLDEPRMDRKINLDILAYWKANQFRYPQIAAFARDVLAIPITTVASESAFSNSGRVLDKYRSSLKADVVEALMCAKDWLFAARGVDGLQENNMEIEELEKDIMELHLESSEMQQDANSVVLS